MTPVKRQDELILDRSGQPGVMANVHYGELIYENALSTQADLAGWRLEGKAAITFPQGRMRLESVIPASEGQKANYVFWCPVDFSDGVSYQWEFYPVREPGLAMFWFSACGRNGEDLFDPALNLRAGEYDQYHHGDINALHASYFRRGNPGTFQLCNLRKSYGFYMVAQGADPIPSIYYDPPYLIEVIKRGAEVQFSINGLVIWYFYDDGVQFGPVLQGGKIGFRQMAPLIAEYANLKVRTVIFH
jgi:hypothetical protein